MGRRRQAWLPGGDGRRVNARAGGHYPGYYVLWWDYSSGRRRMRSKHFNKQSHARKWCRQVNARRDLGTVGEIVPITFRDAFAEFVCGLSARRKGTIREYKTSLPLWIDYCGNFELATIARADVDRFVGRVMETRSEATAAKHIRSIRAFFNWCIKQSYLVSNPLDAATSLPRQGIARVKPPFTHAMFAAILDAIVTDTVGSERPAHPALIESRRVGVLVAATTGLDYNVLRRLTAQDVDLDNGIISTQRLKTRRAVHPFIHDEIAPLLCQLIARTPAGEVLFSGLSRQQRRGGWWKRAVTAAGCPHIRFVDLRSYAVNWMRPALGDFETTTRVGHSSTKVTMKHYTQSDPDAQGRLSSQPLPGSPVRRATPKKGSV